MKDFIWITWERQRRSISLADRLGAAYHELNYSGKLRYANCLLKTTGILLRNRNAIIFIQNPSLILALYATLLKAILGYKLIVDRHTDRFMVDRGRGYLFTLLRFLSNVTIKYADITIVTNQELVPAIEHAGGRAFILPDPYPDLGKYSGGNTQPSTSTFTVFVVASWSQDEPLEAIFKVARRLPETTIVISGRPKKKYSHLLHNLPQNLKLMGFVPEDQYYKTMAESNAVIAFSSQKATLVCGGYEAIQLHKPFITGDSKSLRDYFRPAVFSNGSATDLEEKIKFIQENYETIRAEIVEFHQSSNVAWKRKFDDLLQRLGPLQTIDDLNASN